MPSAACGLSRGQRPSPAVPEQSFTSDMCGRGAGAARSSAAWGLHLEHASSSHCGGSRHPLRPAAPQGQGHLGLRTDRLWLKQRKDKLDTPLRLGQRSATRTTLMPASRLGHMRPSWLLSLQLGGHRPLDRVPLCLPSGHPASGLRWSQPVSPVQSVVTLTSWGDLKPAGSQHSSWPRQTPDPGESGVGDALHRQCLPRPELTWGSVLAQTSAEMPRTFRMLSWGT